MSHLLPEHWIKPLANKQRRKNAAIDAFAACVPKFMKLLADAIEADLEVYRAECPGMTVSVSSIEEDGSMTVVGQSHSPMPAATVQIHSDRQLISCAFDNAKTARNWEERMSLLKTEIACLDLAPEYCAKELSMKILKPVLFPGL